MAKMENQQLNRGSGWVYAVVMLLLAAVAWFLWDCFTGEFRLGD